MRTRVPQSCTVDVLSDPLLNAANLEAGINLMLQAGQRMVEKKRGRWHQWFFSSVSELPFSLGYQSIPLSPLISLLITSFLVPSVRLSVSLLIPFFPPFNIVSTCLCLFPPSLTLILKQSSNSDGIDPIRSPNIDYFSYIEGADMLGINYTCCRAYLYFYRPAAAQIYNVQVEEVSQKRVDKILKWGAGCHGNHMMRQAGLFKGIQLLLAFSSASRRSRGKDKEDGKKRRHDWKINVEYCN